MAAITFIKKAYKRFQQGMQGVVQKANEAVERTEERKRTRKEMLADVSEFQPGGGSEQGGLELG